MHIPQTRPPTDPRRPAGRSPVPPPEQDILPPAPPADPAPGRLLLSVAEARAALGVGHTTLYGLLARGELQARRLGGRTLVEATSLRAFVAALPVARFGMPPGAANDSSPRTSRRGGRRGAIRGTPS